MNRMLHPTNKSVPCAGPVSRRSLLTAGAAAFTGLGLADLLKLQAEAAQTPQVDKDTAVIFVWMPGGPPHMETFDMKPDAPEDYRGAFRPIHTNVPGIDICEHLPLLAKRADKYTLIRSVAHNFADHGGGHKRFMTGRDPKEPTGFVNDYPAVGSMIARSLEKRNVGVPNYVLEVDAGRQGIDTFSLVRPISAAQPGRSSFPAIRAKAAFRCRICRSPRRWKTAWATAAACWPGSISCGGTSTKAAR